MNRALILWQLRIIVSEAFCLILESLVAIVFSRGPIALSEKMTKFASFSWYEDASLTGAMSTLYFERNLS